jgi:enamine deaminase RidA (YjgF/YER057c/UK114 family)
MTPTTPVQHLNPEGLHQNHAFTNVVTIAANARTIYVGGQNALTADGEIVGKGDLTAQTEQIFHNLETALAAAGSRLQDVVKWNIYVVHGQPINSAFEVFQRVWGRKGNPPAITVAQVAALANPEALVELDAIAVLPAEG